MDNDCYGSVCSASRFLLYTGILVMTDSKNNPSVSREQKNVFTVRQLINPSGCFTVCLLLTLGLTWSSKLISDDLSSVVWIYGGIITFLVIPVAYLADKILADQENKMKGKNDK